MAVLRLTDGVFNEDTGVSLQVTSVQATQSNNGEWSIRWSVPTAEDSKTIDTDVGAGGRFLFIHRGSTNPISIGWATASYFTTLEPGEAASGRVPSGTTTVYAASTTAAEDLQIIIFKA